MAGETPRRPGKKAAPGTDWVALADVMRPHGVAGELRLRMYNADSDVLVSADEVLVRDGAGGERVMVVQWMRPADHGHLLAKLEGVDDRDDADAFRTSVVCAKRSAFAPLEEGEFYACDLVGARLVGPEGDLGVVEELRTYPSTDVLLVRPEPASKLGTVEIPLVDDYVDSVDVERKVVLVRSAALQFFQP
jgi:16S rRNA processing protein RimM